MKTITIPISDDRYSQLQVLAGRYGLSLDELVRLSIEDLLAQPDETFRRALDYVLDKNSELYRRLAV